MTRIGRAVLLAAALAAGACKSETTPVEPRTLPSLGLSVLPAAAGDRPGTLTLEGHFCPCAGGSVSVTINGTPSGSLGCGETKVFPASSVPLRLQLTSPATSPLDAVIGTLEMEGPTPELAGMRAGVWCAVPAG